jgi:hypothetical protein
LPKQQTVVEKRSAEQGFRNFFPRQLRIVRHARRRRQVDAPLIRRSIFVALGRWPSVHGAICVASLSISDDRPHPPPVGVVEALIQSAAPAGRLRVVHDPGPRQRVGLTTAPWPRRKACSSARKSAGASMGCSRVSAARGA